MIQHALRPLLESNLEVTTRTFVSWLPEVYPSAAEALLTVQLLSALPYDDDRRRAAYLNCARIAEHDFPPWDSDTQFAYTGRLLAALAADDHAGADIAIRCAAAVLERTRPSDPAFDAFSNTITRLIRKADTEIGADRRTRHLAYRLASSTADDEAPTVPVAAPTGGQATLDYLLREVERRADRLARAITALAPQQEALTELHGEASGDVGRNLRSGRRQRPQAGARQRGGATPHHARPRHRSPVARRLRARPADRDLMANQRQGRPINACFSPA